MAKRMLVDATHPEETRVVVVNGTKLEEFDFETSTKKQLKGNIYLAKVIRIEPSLQAAFVEYGGNRHGFLAFSEIHPDYYQIPVADREAILAEQERRARQAEESEGQERPQRRRRHDRRGRHGDRQRRGEAPEAEQAAAPADGEATDAIVAPDQAGLDDQPIVETWDHEAAQAGYPAAEADESVGSDADVAGDDGSAERQAGDGGDGEEDDFEEREPLNPHGDFRETETDWSASGEDSADEGTDESEERDTPASDDDAEASAASDGGEEEQDDAPRSYAAERQDWPATYAAESEEAQKPADAGAEPDEATVTAAPDAVAEPAADDDATLAPAEGQDIAVDTAPNGESAEANGGEALAVAEAAGAVETVGGEDLGEEERPRRPPTLRNYKIQEVIKRRQILLVQVVKEERGNKGAALTTYLSLAGRYAVLMPNAGRGGGISRKITNAADRKRMREMLSELEVPQGMGVILRTAGLERSKPEIKRDYDYLIRLWDSIRDLTLKSTAPALIYEEGNLIKRSIRDLYGKDIEDVLIEGEAAYNNARDFMRQLMPSHVKKVQLYRESIPLFHRYQVETQLDAMHSPVVQLKSGAYIVINPTEALVAIDVNSGRATKERNIEETALRTNMEAAEEIARQLRLRDLAGLIVIDFIDMEDQRHQAQVERKLKEAMRSDRARIQIGRISAFGLLELSRQRLRPSLLETSTEICPHCEGTGRIRSTESTVLHVLRAIEEEGIRRRAAEIRVTVPTHVALYLLNQKRAGLAEIEQRYGLRVLVDGDDRLIPPNFTLERSRNRPADAATNLPALATANYDETEFADEETVEEVETAEEAADGTVAADAAGENGNRRRRRRRGDDAEGTGVEAVEDSDGSDDGEAALAGEADAAESRDVDSGEEAEDSAGIAASEDTAGESDIGEDGQPRRRRRGRRGGRRRRQGDRNGDDTADIAAAEAESEASGEPEATPVQDGDDAAPPVEAMLNGSAVSEETVAATEEAVRLDQDSTPAASAEAEPEAREPEKADELPAAPQTPAEPSGPPRRGWWTRLTSGT